MTRMQPYLLVMALLACSAPIPAQRLKTHIGTEKGESYEAALPHPLSWWTRDPLRLDTAGDLMIGISAKGGQPIGARDYRIAQKLNSIGGMAGHRILELVTTFRPGPRVIAEGFATAGNPPVQWKTLLVSADGGYVAVYALRYDMPGLMRFGPAQIYGSGPNAILGTYDPDTGNGGGCFEGYWWFDRAGVYNVDFSPLNRAIAAALPDGASSTSGCWALDPNARRIRSGVFQNGHAYDQIGEVVAAYRIEQGKAYAEWVHFTPEKQQ